MSGQTADTGNGSDVHDAAFACTEHRRQHMVRDIVEPFGGSAHHIVPVILAHKDHQPVSAYTGIVHQHGDMFAFVSLFPSRQCSLDSLAVCYIKRKQFGLASCRFNSLLTADC